MPSPTRATEFRETGLRATESGPGRRARAICDAAYAAGRLILDARRAGCAMRLKTDGTPVTLADESADALIRDRIAAEEPGAAIVSEECGDLPEQGACRLVFWLVDPLDGTRDWLTGSDEFTVNICRVVNGRPDLAVLSAPALGRLFVADGGVAWEIPLSGRSHAPDYARRVRLHARMAPDEGPVALESRSYQDTETRAWLDKLGVQGRRQASSSLKFALIAAGEADLTVRVPSLREWDIAAGICILEAAGGVVRDVRGLPLRFGDIDGGLGTPPFAAVGDVRLMADALAHAPGGVGVGS